MKRLPAPSTIDIDGITYEVVGMSGDETVLRGPHGYKVIDPAEIPSVPFTRHDITAGDEVYLPDGTLHRVTVAEPTTRRLILEGTDGKLRTADYEAVTPHRRGAPPVSIEPRRTLTISIPLPEDEIVDLDDVQWLMEMLATHHETAKAGIIHRDRLR